MKGNADPRNRLVGRCVDCRIESLVPGDEGFTCNSCGRCYGFDTDGILRAFPQKRSTPPPSFYNTEEYKEWLHAWEEMIDEWIIYKNSFYRWFSMSGARGIRKLINKCLINTGPFLDLGCGHGQLFSLLDPARCIGLDSNLEFLRILKKRYPHALAVQGDFQNTPFRTGSIKCAISIHTLEHLYFLAESLEELLRILNPEGYFLFSIPTEGGLGWELGRRLVTGPYMKRKFNLDIKKIMDIEHINDAHRLLKFLNFYFKVNKIVYSPFPFLRNLHVNSTITGFARPRESTKTEV